MANEKYLRQYQTDGEFADAAGTELKELSTFVAHAEESGKVYYKNTWDRVLPPAFKSENIPGSLQIYNAASSEKKIIKVQDYVDNYKDSADWSVVGIVVIPKMHDVYGTGEGALISLQDMSYSTPNTGTNSTRKYMNWGYNKLDIPELNNLTYAPCLGDGSTWTVADNVVDHMQQVGSGIYLPSDRTDSGWTMAINNHYDPGTSWKASSTNHHAPSPYLNATCDRNPEYFKTSYLDADDNVLPNSELNCLADFAGKSNTDIILSKVTVTNWRTADTIANSHAAGNYPAACCCWRYSVPGTKQGDWYLPAAGELGYMIVRLQALNTALAAVGALTISTDNYYWSSTERSAGGAVYLLTSDGYISWSGKDYDRCVRAFARF